jgi:hypothetical protein
MITSPARFSPAGLILAAAVAFAVSAVLERHDGTTGQLHPLSRMNAHIALESMPLIVGVVVVSVVLTLALLTIGARWIPIVITLVMAAFVALDAVTVIYDVAQPGGSPGDILAAFAMVLHVLACFTVAYVARPSPATR